MTTTPVLGITELASGQAVPETTVNEANRYLEQGARHFVIVDRDLSAPAGGEADGSAYIVSGTGTGAWAGHDGDIAFKMSTGWLFINVTEGMSFWIADENKALVATAPTTFVELATGVSITEASVATVNTGTSTTEYVSPDSLAGSNFGTAVVSIIVTDPNGNAITTGDGQAHWFVPSTLNGRNLVGVAAAVTTVSSSGTPTIQIHNVTQAADMLTTRITIDASEKHSKDATVAAVIDAANDDVATGDELRFDVDVAGTGAKGLVVELQFRLP